MRGKESKAKRAFCLTRIEHNHTINFTFFTTINGLEVRRARGFMDVKDFL